MESVWVAQGREDMGALQEYTYMTRESWSAFSCSRLWWTRSANVVYASVLKSNSTSVCLYYERL